MGLFDRFTGSKQPEVAKSRDERAAPAPTPRVVLDEEGPYTSSMKVDQAVSALLKSSDDAALIEYLEKHADDKDARGGRGYLRAAELVYEHVIGGGGTPRLVQWLLLHGPFEYQEMPNPYKLVDRLSSEEETLDVYFMTRSSAVRKEACSRLGQIGGTRSLQVLGEVEK